MIMKWLTMLEMEWGKKKSIKDAEGPKEEHRREAMNMG